MLGETVYRERIERVRDYISDKRASLVLITSTSPNFLYLTGIHYEMRERLIALVLTRDNDPLIIAPSFEVSNLRGLTCIRDFLPWEEEQDPYQVLIQNLNLSYAANHVVAFDDSTPLGVFWAMSHALGGIQHGISITPLLRGMRIKKSDLEVDMIRQASRIIDKAIAEGLRHAAEGITELELKQTVQKEIIRHGAQPTFGAVLFGTRSALPHADTSQARLKRNEAILLDCGCAVAGYNTDITRVGFYGTPSEEFQRVYTIVRRAEETAIERIKAGLRCEDADSIARDMIQTEGYGERFTHRLGHGIGLEVHEPPYLVRGNKMVLEPGMTHSVEPGIYIEGSFGVRIEDLVCIRKDDCEVLTQSPRDLYVIK